MPEFDRGNLAILAEAAKHGWDYFGIDGLADNHALFCQAANPDVVLEMLEETEAVPALTKDLGRSLDINLKLAGQIQGLEDTQQRHLRLIVNLSKESISTDEAQELRAQIASLIAEVGTLRSNLREGIPT